MLTQRWDEALDQEDLQSPGLTANQSIEGVESEVLNLSVCVADVTQLQIRVTRAVTKGGLVVAVAAVLRELQE